MKTVKRKVCKRGYILGYWKRERIALVPQYHPEAKPGEYLIEEVEVPSDCSLPRIIDPRDMSLSEIKEICSVNDVRFSWITGINPRDWEAARIVGDTLVHEAIEYFIAFGKA